MTHISNVINVGSLSVAREEKQSHTTINPLSAKLVEYVFAKFYLLCRGADVLFADSKRLAAEKTQWQATFSREGLTSIDHVRQGLLKLERHTYPNPPQLGEFLKWNQANSSDLGFLSKEQAFLLAAQFMRDGFIANVSADQNEIIRHVLNESDRFFMKHNPLIKTQPVFYRNYEIAIRDFTNGKLNRAPKGIENKIEERKELLKQEIIKKDFSHLRGYEQNMPEIRKKLRISLDGSNNSPFK